MRRQAAFRIACAALAALATLAAGRPLGAQVLAGRVQLDPSGIAAAGTLVIGVGDAARIVAVARADSTGVFALELGRAGEYRLLFFRAGAPAVATPTFTLDTTAYVEREFRIPGDGVAGEPVRLAGEVNARATALPRTGAPKYPEAQARRGERGRVRVLFVVDTTGQPDVRTLEIVGTTHEAFVAPVRRALGGARFTPALLAGRAVPQLFEQTYDFGCPDDPVEIGAIAIRTFYSACTGR